MRFHLIHLFLLLAMDTHGQDWEQLGEGFEILDGTVHSLYYNESNGLLYAGGNFIDASSDILTSRIAYWDGISWHQMGCGFKWDCDETNPPDAWSHPVLDILSFNDTIYACGFFNLSGSNVLNNIAKWDGENWVSVGEGLDAVVRQMRVINGELFAVGGFTESPGYSEGLHGFAKWDGSGWSDPLDLPRPDGETLQQLACIHSYAGDIYLGGNLTSSGWLSDLVRWDGNDWEAVPGYIDGFISIVEDLAVYDGKLIVTGNFLSEVDGLQRNSIASWDGANWNNMNGGIRNSQDLSSFAHVMELHATADYLYAAGGFRYAGEIQTDHLAKWDGEKWCGYGSDNGEFFANGTLASIITMDDKPVTGGYYLEIGGEDIRKVAVYTGDDDCVISNVEDELVTVNPTLKRTPFGFEITSPVPFSGFEIFDVTGKEIIKVENQWSTSHNINVSSLSNGLYIIVIGDNQSTFKVFLGH